MLNSLSSLFIELEFKTCRDKLYQIYMKKPNLSVMRNGSNNINVRDFKDINEKHTVK